MLSVTSRRGLRPHIDGGFYPHSKIGAKFDVFTLHEGASPSVFPVPFPPIPLVRWVVLPRGRASGGAYLVPLHPVLYRENIAMEPIPLLVPPITPVRLSAAHGDYIVTPDEGEC